MSFYSRRPPILSRHGMVATSQPLAAMAGLKTLMDGGNAIDAAVAAAATLSVVEPGSTGIGGDLFALVWMNKEKEVRALNASGRAPAAASIEELKGKGFSKMPQSGPYSISVPGAVDGWHTLLTSHGSMQLSDVLAPAINYAENGYAVTEVIARHWAAAIPRLASQKSGAEFMIDGRAPRWGEVIKLPTLARTLKTIAEGGPEVLYKGPLAQKTAEFVQAMGGWLTTNDMATHTSDWEQPISTDYRGITIWECPPNTHSIATLMALNIAEGFDLHGMGLQSAETYHHLIEAMRLAYSDTFHYVADPKATYVPTQELLSKQYAAKRRNLVNNDRSIDKTSFGNVLTNHDTVYVACIDRDGNACSLINSIFQTFGTGLVVPGTGIALHNRASLFSLEPDHPNALAPGKRPYHTLMPALATQNGELWLCFGVMGSFQQPQGQLQVLVNMIDFGLNPQEALNALRFSVRLENGIALEKGLSQGVLSELKQKGHQIFLSDGHDPLIFGGGQIIAKDLETGTLIGGSEPRNDGCAVGW